MSTRVIHVLKFGSSVLERPEDYRLVAAEICAEVEKGRKVVAVVSAMGRTTDELLAAVKVVTQSPPHSLLVSLLATGEEASVALLSMALAAKGVRATDYTVAELPVYTRGPLEDAEPVGVDSDRIRSALEISDAIIVPGFVGMDLTGVPSLLGRGGSDLTALFLGHVLGAEVRLVKDFDGIYPQDPRLVPDAAPFRYLSWEGVNRIGGDVVQEKAVDFARGHKLGFRVTALGGTGTWVGPLAARGQNPPGIRAAMHPG